jgi:zinc transport system permease protein
VIVLIAVAVYVVAVAVGKLQTALGDESTPETGSIETGSPGD